MFIRGSFSLFEIRVKSMRYSWLDLVFYTLAFVLLVPLVMRLAESVMSCLE